VSSVAGFSSSVIVVGLLPSLRARLESEFLSTVEIRALLAARDGGLRLEFPPLQSCGVLDQCFQDSPAPAAMLIIVLPYPEIDRDVLGTVEILEELGVPVLRPSPNADGWPSRPKAFDKAFQDTLLHRLVDAIRSAFELTAPPPPEPSASDYEEALIEDLLRGLISHHKMGRNNHSHEDDFWKDRGREMRSGDKHKLVMRMMSDGLVDRKKNDSAGGRGWVYWVADVGRVRERFVSLRVYLDPPSLDQN
jgi:hypothetical protein